MARLAIFGATRGIGRAAVACALAEGHTVRAVARGADGMDLDHPALEPVAADATDPAAVAGAVAGVDAVIQALGVKISPRTLCREVTLFSEATRALIPAMEAAGVARLVTVTGFGTGDSRARLSAPERLAQRIALGPAYEDKDRQEALIRESGLDWLILRPVILTDGRASGRVRVLRRPAAWRNGLVSRADVAEVLVREATQPSLHRETPVIAS